MATKKATKVRRSSRPRPDRYSKAKKGYISQSVRMTVDENKVIREAAALGGESINFFATRALLAAAKARIAEHINHQEAE